MAREFVAKALIAPHPPQTSRFDNFALNSEGRVGGHDGRPLFCRFTFDTSVHFVGASFKHQKWTSCLQREHRIPCSARPESISLQTAHSVGRTKVLALNR